eukprot:Pgem_evm1s17150
MMLSNFKIGHASRRYFSKPFKYPFLTITTTQTTSFTTTSKNNEFEKNDQLNFEKFSTATIEKYLLENKLSSKSKVQDDGYKVGFDVDRKLLERYLRGQENQQQTTINDVMEDSTTLKKLMEKEKSKHSREEIELMELREYEEGRDFFQHYIDHTSK